MSIDHTKMHNGFSIGLLMQKLSDVQRKATAPRKNLNQGKLYKRQLITCSTGERRGGNGPTDSIGNVTNLTYISATECLKKRRRIKSLASLSRNSN